HSKALITACCPLVDQSQAAGSSDVTRRAETPVEESRDLTSGVPREISFNGSKPRERKDGAGQNSSRLRGARRSFGYGLVEGWIPWFGVHQSHKKCFKRAPCFLDF